MSKKEIPIFSKNLPPRYEEILTNSRRQIKGRFGKDSSCLPASMGIILGSRVNSANDLLRTSSEEAWICYKSGSMVITKEGTCYSGETRLEINLENLRGKPLLN